MILERWSLKKFKFVCWKKSYFQYFFELFLLNTGKIIFIWPLDMENWKIAECMYDTAFIFNMTILEQKVCQYELLYLFLYQIQLWFC